MCSCAHPTDENINGGVITNNTNATYVGVWQASTSKYGDIFPTSIELLSNGRALFLNVDSYQIDEAPWALVGEWMVETGRIIVFYEYDGSENFPYSQVYIFEVKSDKEIVLPMLDLTYKKL